jgi:RNA polymerase sigma-B factor
VSLPRLIASGEPGGPEGGSGLPERMSGAGGRHAQWAHAQRVRRAEERALFARLAEDPSPASRDALVERFMPLARQLARRYSGSYELEDLEQVAAIGLVKAIGRFDPERGLAFSTFAFPTIMGELKRHLRDHGWSIRVPRSLQEVFVRLDRATAELAMALGRAPTAAELAERVGSTAEQILEARRAATAFRADSLDQPRNVGDDLDAAGIDVAIDEAGFAVAEDAAILDGLFACLSARERLVLRLRFEDDLTQSEIGEIVGVSQMQVSRLLRRAIARLQAAARGQQAAA